MHQRSHSQMQTMSLQLVYLHKRMKIAYIMLYTIENEQ